MKYVLTLFSLQHTHTHNHLPTTCYTAVETAESISSSLLLVSQRYLKICSLNQMQTYLFRQEE